MNQTTATGKEKVSKFIPNKQKVDTFPQKKHQKPTKILKNAKKVEKCLHI